MNQVWDTEKSMWLGGADAFEAAMAQHCLMAFGPMGIMTDAAIPDRLRDAPRWTDATFTQKTLVTPSPTTIVLGYKVKAQRSGADPYFALCSSTYILDAKDWKLVQHQQTEILD